MKRATELFDIERWDSPSPLASAAWWTRSEPEGRFVSVAVTNWELVVTRQRSRAWVTLRGPETKATAVPIPQDASFFGIELRLGTFLPGLDMRRLVDRAYTLPPATGPSFWFGGSSWEIPGPEDADALVDRWARAGLLVHDPLVPATIAGDDAGLSTRSVQRRVMRATGLTGGTIRQIRRAEQAVDLLAGGLSIQETTHRTGYADQSHLTRSLARFVGQTPTRVRVAPDHPSLSLPFKTERDAEG